MKKTQQDREYVVQNFKNNPDNKYVKEAMKRIFDEVLMMQIEEDGFVSKTVRGERDPASFYAYEEELSSSSDDDDYE